MKPHTKLKLLTPTRAKGDTRNGPGHDGVPRHFARPGEPSLISHPGAVPSDAGKYDHNNTHATLGVAPKPKHANLIATPLHSGAMSRYDADPAVAMGGPPAGKVTKRAEINPGSRSRNLDSLASENAGVAHARAKAKGHEELHSLGQAILAEAAYGKWRD
ncbi:MAG: hypothetical protein ACLPKT_06015 [Methylocella sp.]